jgi:hypothetical protein
LQSLRSCFLLSWSLKASPAVGLRWATACDAASRNGLMAASRTSARRLW